MARGFSDLDDLWAAWSASRASRDRDALVMASQPLIGATVSRLAASSPRAVDREDQVGYGQLGLLEAIDRYNPDLGVQFVYYAMLKIRSAVLDGLRDFDWAPKRYRQSARALAQAEEQLVHRLHRVPTDPEVAGVLHCTVAEVQEMRVMAFQAVMTTSTLPVDVGGEHTAGGQFYEVDVLDVANADDGADATLSVAVVRQQLAAALNRITDPTHHQVLRLYYVDRLPMAKAGEVLGVSASQFSKMRDRAVAELQANIGL